MPNIEKIVSNKLVAEGPQYREIIEGINFKAKCNTCNEIVFIKIGMNKNQEYFDIGKIIGKQTCSKCFGKLTSKEIKNIVFL